jgi:hypothetical protein
MLLKLYVRTPHFRHKLLETASERMHTDGLNSLKYEVVAKQYKKLYTWLLVSFDDNVWEDG